MLAELETKFSAIEELRHLVQEAMDTPTSTLQGHTRLTGEQTLEVRYKGREVTVKLAHGYVKVTKPPKTTSCDEIIDFVRDVLTTYRHPAHRIAGLAAGDLAPPDWINLHVSTSKVILKIKDGPTMAFLACIEFDEPELWSTHLDLGTVRVHDFRTEKNKPSDVSEEQAEEALAYAERLVEAFKRDQGLEE